MSPLSRIGFLLAAVLIAGWLFWLTNMLLDLREWTEKALNGRQHGEPAAPDAVDEALRRFSFGGGNDGRAGGLNFVSDETRHAQARSIHGDGTAEGSGDATEGKQGIDGE